MQEESHYKSKKTPTKQCTIEGSRIINIGKYVGAISQHSASRGGTIILTGEKWLQLLAANARSLPT